MLRNQKLLLIVVVHVKNVIDYLVLRQPSLATASQVRPRAEDTTDLRLVLKKVRMLSQPGQRTIGWLCDAGNVNVRIMMTINEKEKNPSKSEKRNKRINMY